MRIATIFLFACLFKLTVNAQYAIRWITQQPHTIGKLIKCTSDNKIIVCGTFGNDYPSDWGDIVINCFDTSGNLLWQKYFSDTINGGIEEPFDMELDSQNNVYIAGRMHLSYDGLPITPNALLLKYDSNGNLIWYKQLGDTLGFKGAARRLHINNGNIYVAGFMTPIAGGTNHSLLAKYDTSGQLNWVKIDTNQYETIGRSVLMDNASNIYLVGTSACCTPGYKMFVSRYDSFGNKDWTTIIYDTAHIYTYTWESTIDDSANIYITGETQDTAFSTAYDCAIAKLDSSGIQKWFYSYTTDSSYYWEESNSIISNSQNGVFVTGSIDASSTGYGFIVNLSTDGVLTWDSIYNQYPAGTGFRNTFFDVDSNVIVCGAGFFDGITEELRIFSLHPNGSQLWTVGVNGRFAPADGIYCNGNYYITGYNPPGTGNTSDDSLYVFQVNYQQPNIIVENIRTNDLSIFPNPASQSIRILSPKYISSSSIRIYNSIGKEIYFLENSSKSIDLEISCVTWPKGIYILQFTGNSLSTFHKLILN